MHPENEILDIIIRTVKLNQGTIGLKHADLLQLLFNGEPSISPDDASPLIDFLLDEHYIKIGVRNLEKTQNRYHLDYQGYRSLKNGGFTAVKKLQSESRDVAIKTLSYTRWTLIVSVVAILIATLTAIIPLIPAKNDPQKMNDIKKRGTISNDTTKQKKTNIVK